MPSPILSVEQMRAWEARSWQAGRNEEAVMRQAGRAVARCAERLTRPGQHLLALAGQGHNGDDTRYAAEAVVGRAVTVLKVKEPVAAKKEILAALEQKPALVLDGLFGIGLNRPLDDAWVDLIRAINATGSRVLAVDVPSGLNANTGEPMPEAIRAAHTLTLGAPKCGLLAASAWPFTGRLEVAPDIGLVPLSASDVSFAHTDPQAKPLPATHWTLPEDFIGYPPPRPVAGHKGSFGHLAIVAGSMGYHGAAVLAARAAQRSQPGLITLITSDAAYAPVAAQLQAVMVRPGLAGPELPSKTTALLIGPGLAAAEVPESLRTWTQLMWAQSPWPVVIDASTLEWLAPGPCAADALRVITPHPGEAARMLGCTADEIQSDRSNAALALSQRYGGCQVVLKGHQTLIGDSRGGLFVNSSGNPHLAQGGSGDVLAGYLAGLLAQPALAADALTALRFAVWQHGAAADALTGQRGGWTVEDLATTLGSVAPG